jgi:uncharacterized membrane protein
VVTYKKIPKHPEKSFESCVWLMQALEFYFTIKNGQTLQKAVFGNASIKKLRYFTIKTCIFQKSFQIFLVFLQETSECQTLRSEWALKILPVKTQDISTTFADLLKSL